MTQSMKAAVMIGNNRMEIQERPIPVPGDDEALIKIEYVGICGSDLHIYSSDWGKRITRPHVLGHECAGAVVQIGKNVKSVAVGDRVALEPGKSCGHCEYCRSGKYNLCPEVVFLGAPTMSIPQVDGAFVEYLSHPAELCFKLPDNVSTLEGALIEPFAVGIHAARTGGAGPGMTAAVVGAGCIGLVSMMALRIFGVPRVFVLDVMDNRLESARRLGADATFNSTSPDAAKQVVDRNGGKGCALAVDTSGAGSAVAQAVECLKKGGALTLVGYSRDGSLVIPLRTVINKEIRIETIFRYRNVYPIAIEAASAGLVDLKSIVSDIRPLDDIAAAFEANIENKDSVIKSVVKIA